MLSQTVLQSYINQAIATQSDAAAFAAASNTTPAFADELCRYLEQHELENTLNDNGDKPFTEIQVNLIEKKWQDDYWWGPAYLSIKISKLAPVFSCEKVMMQLDHSIEGVQLNRWHHLAAEGEKAVLEAVNGVAPAIGFSRLVNELKQDVDTGAVPLNAHYRKWKPTVYALFFEKIT
jgi:hypothetical protein